MNDNPPIDLDVRPANWHPSWIRYSEFNGVACILHYVGTANIHLCVIHANCVPTDNHHKEDWTPEFLAVYGPLSFGGSERNFSLGRMEAAINLWVLWDAKIRLTSDFVGEP